MRCKTCDYRLWNIRGRQCPECGTSFRPSEFEFTPNAVEFCCPHCDTAYYGTTFNGQLSPTLFDCVNCGQRIHMDEMVLRPAPGCVDEDTVKEGNPWLMRSHRGSIKAWFATIGWGLIQPGRLLKSTPASETGSAWSFSLITIFLSSLFSILVCAPFMIMMLFIVPAGTGPGPVFEMIGTMGMWLAMAAIGTLAGMLLWMVAAHGIMKVSKAKHAHPMGRTFQAFAYTSGPCVLMAIPCMGPYFFWVWWVVSATIALKEAQQITGGKASLAAITPPVTIVLLLVGGYALLIAYAFSANAMPVGPGGAAWGTGVNNAQVVTDAIIDYANDSDGDNPSHVAELIVYDYLDSYSFSEFTSIPGTSTDPSKIVVGDKGLITFEFMSQSEQLELLESSAKLPDDVIAHRLGDYVFTYHGIDLTDADPGLWIVILSPDPAQNTGNPLTTITVGLADGSIKSFSSSLLIEELETQNLLREKLELGHLPKPSTVDHGMPAIAP